MALHDWILMIPDPGSYVVVRTNGWVAKTIRVLTDGWANHAFIVGYDGKIIEAQPGGVVLSEFEKYKGYRMAANSPDDFRPGDREKVVNAALNMVGKPYNDIDILELGLESIGLGMWLLRQIANDDGAAICSQLVAACGQSADLNWLCGKNNTAQVRPVDLEERPGVKPFTL